MKIMSINAGSSSLKFSLFNMDTEEVIASGLFERIGIENGHYVIKFNGEKIESSNVKIKFSNTYEIKKIQRLKRELLKELI